MFKKVRLHSVSKYDSDYHRSQAIAVRDSLAALYSTDKTCPEMFEWRASTRNTNNLESFLKREQNNANDIHNIIVGVGSDGFNFLANMDRSNLPSNISIHWQGDRLIKGLREYADRFDTISLPEHVLTTQLKAKLDKKTIVIPTSNVPHNERTSKLKDLSKSSDLPTDDELYHAVFLGGDYLDINSDIRNITEIEAIKYADKVAEIAKQDNAGILLVNQIYTGIYNKSDNSFSSKLEEIDPISKIFMERLAKKGVKTKFYNRSSGKKDPIKEVAVIAYIESNNKAKVFTTGDELSVITKSQDIIKPQNIYVMNTSNMNQHAVSYVNSLSDKNNINLLSYENGNVTQKVAKVSEDVLGKSSAVDNISKAIYDKVKSKYEDLSVQKDIKDKFLNSAKDIVGKIKDSTLGNDKVRKSVKRKASEAFNVTSHITRNAINKFKKSNDNNIVIDSPIKEEKPIDKAKIRKIAGSASISSTKKIVRVDTGSDISRVNEGKDTPNKERESSKPMVRG